MKFIFAVSIVSAIIIFLVITYLENQPFSCPDPSDLYSLSQNPIYHHMAVYFDDNIQPHVKYNFMRTRLNYHFNNKWQCAYYSDSNSPVMASIEEPTDGLKQEGTQWVDYHSEGVCVSSIEACQVRK